MYSLMSRNACNGGNGEKWPASGDLNWMPKVAPWRLAILAKLAISAKIARGLLCFYNNMSRFFLGVFSAELN